jgi:hypothetical protein
MGHRTMISVRSVQLGLGLLSACAAPGFKAEVARFQQLPPAQGQSFTVMPEDARLAGSLEFAHYADQIARQLAEKGYVRSSDPAGAQLVVRIDYDVDKGSQRIVSSGFSRAPWGYDPFYYPGFYGPYRRSRFIMGWHDPFLWGSGYNDVEAYVVYQSKLRMRIDSIEGQRLFEGTAKAQSLSNKLTYLMPNLIEALFTGFPGTDGEEIKVTVAPEPKK